MKTLARVLVMLFTLFSAQALASGSNGPRVQGKTTVMGVSDAGQYPTPVEGGILYDPIFGAMVMSDGGVWTQMGSGSGSSGTLTNQHAVPTAPATDNTLLWAMGVGNGTSQGSLAYLSNSDGFAFSLMGPHGGARCGDIGAPASSPNLGVTAIGATSVPAPATTSYQAQLPVFGTQTTSTSNDQWVGVYMGGTNPYGYWRGNAAGFGGFLYRTRVGFCSADANQRAFFGLYGTNAAITGAVEPSSLLQTVYIGCDNGDANMGVCSNDGTGSATCNTLGASFPCKTNLAMYDIAFYSAPNGSAIGYAIRRLDSAAFATGNITSDLPSNTTFLTYQNVVSNGPSGGTAACIALVDSCFFTP